MRNRTEDAGEVVRSGRRLRRAGFSLLEVQVAFVLLGISLAGVCPLIVMQVKLSKRVASGFGQNGQFQPGGRTFLVMSANRWSRKLGASAQLSTTSTAVAPPAQGPYKLSVLVPPPRPFGSETLHIQLQRTPPSSGGSTP
jgi:hypothetical protein